MYDEVVTSVRTSEGIIMWISYHSRFALSPNVFESIDEISWCILFANDKDLLDETRRIVNDKKFGDRIERLFT